MGFLDSSGLSHFWDKVKVLINKKQDTLTADTGIRLSNNAISVETPVKGLTKAEYDVLTDEQKNSGLYVITDMDPQEALSGATFTPSVSPEGNLSWTNDKGLPNPEPVNIKGPQGEDASEVYSTEETVIGTWIDGKPLYSRTLTGYIGKEGVWLSTKVSDNIETIVALFGTYVIYGSAGERVFRPLPYMQIGGENVYGIELEADAKLGVLYVINKNFGAVISQPYSVTCKYTKTTDVTTIPQAAILTSEVTLPETSPSVSYVPASTSSANSVPHTINESPGSSGIS